MPTDNEEEPLQLEARYIIDTDETLIMIRLKGTVAEDILADMLEAVEMVWDGRAAQERQRMDDTVALLRKVIQGYKP